MLSSLRKAVVAVFGLLLAPNLSAQTLLIDPASGPRGGSVDVVIRFEAGALPVDGYDLVFNYPVGLFGAPSVIPGAGACAANVAQSRIGVVRVAPLAGPLANELTCTVRFPVAPAAPLGTYSYTNPQFNFADAASNPVAGNFAAGPLQVTAAASPTLAYTPAADLDGVVDGIAEVQLLAPMGQSSPSASIGVASNGGSAGTGVNLACAISPGFTIVSGANQNLVAGGPAAAIGLACSLAGATAAGTLTCAEQDTPSGASRVRIWELVCAGPLLVDGFEPP